MRRPLNNSTSLSFALIPCINHVTFSRISSLVQDKEKFIAYIKRKPKLFNKYLDFLSSSGEPENLKKILKLVCIQQLQLGSLLYQAADNGQTDAAFVILEAQDYYRQTIPNNILVKISKLALTKGYIPIAREIEADLEVRGITEKAAIREKNLDRPSNPFYPTGIRS